MIFIYKFREPRAIFKWYKLELRGQSRALGSALSRFSREEKSNSLKVSSQVAVLLPYFFADLYQWVYTFSSENTSHDVLIEPFPESGWDDDEYICIVRTARRRRTARCKPRGKGWPVSLPTNRLPLSPRIVPTFAVQGRLLLPPPPPPVSGKINWGQFRIAELLGIDSGTRELEEWSKEGSGDERLR